MNILLIENTFTHYLEIKKAFESLDIGVIEIKGPSVTPIDQFLTILLDINKNNTISFVLSIGYDSNISLACGALGIKYAAWIYSIENLDQYDKTMHNEWNYYYVANHEMCDILYSKGIKNITFLPFASSSNLQFSLTDEVLVGHNLSYVDDCVYSELSQLLDSTKGYIDGIVACATQVHKPTSIINVVPGYILDDLITNYPRTDNSIFDNREYYIYKYLIDNISCDEVETMYTTLVNMKILGTITKNNIYDGTRQVSTLMNVLIPSQSFFSTIPPAIWDYLALGYPIIIPKQLCIANDLNNIPSFSNRKELIETTYDVLKNSETYKNQALHLSKTIKENHSYNARIIKIIGTIN